MTIYSKNKKKLSFRYHELFQKLDAIDEISPYEFLQSKNQNLTLKFQNIFLYSAYDPVKETEKELKQIKIADIMILIGIGLGYKLEAFFKNKNIKKIYIIEFDLGYVKQLFSVKEFSILAHSKVELIYNVSNLSMVVSWFDLIDYKTINIIIEKNIQPQKKQIIEFVQTLIQNKKTELLTYSKFGKIWFDNFLQNYKLKKSMKSCEQLSSDMQTKPILLIGAGPSLQSSIPYIQSIQKEIYIVAVDTILKYLLKQKIYPNLVISVDSQPISRLHFYNVYNENIFFLFDTLSNPILVKKYINQSYFYKSGNPLNQFFSNILQTNVGLSAVNIAIDILYQLGIRDIYLSGVDFAYHKTQLYTGGNYFSLYWSTRITKSSPLDTKYYEYYRHRKLKKHTSNLYTTPIMEMYGQALNQYIEEKKDLNVFSLSQNTLKMDQIQFAKQIKHYNYKTQKQTQKQETLFFECIKEFQTKKVSQFIRENKNCIEFIYPIIYYKLYRLKNRAKKNNFKEAEIQKIFNQLLSILS